MTDELQQLQREFEFRRIRRREPPSIARILSELTSRRGLGRKRSQEYLEDAWRSAIGEPGAQYTRVGALRRGVLEIIVSNSVLLQELAGFQKQSLVQRMKQVLQSDSVIDIRFRLDVSR
jgi:hypothetical protein